MLIHFWHVFRGCQTGTATSRPGWFLLPLSSYQCEDSKENGEKQDFKSVADCIPKRLWGHSHLCQKLYDIRPDGPS